MSSSTVCGPAKINLQLSVGPLREDGFHELATVFCAVSLYDEVTAEPADRWRLTASGPSADGVPLGEDNLAARAVRLLADEAGRPPALAVHLTKRIPVGGGMAGGSADAAGALLAAATLWGLDLPVDRLVELAASLGSDVPFAVLGGVALGHGRGEKLTPVATTGSFSWVFAVADGGLSTPAVYAECDRLRAGRDVPPPIVSEALLAALTAGDPVALGAAVSNDLQDAAVRLRPELAGTLDAGLRAGALTALVSGSGPTCLFLAADEPHAGDLVERLHGLPGVAGVQRVTGPVAGARIC